MGGGSGAGAHRQGTLSSTLRTGASRCAATWLCLLTECEQRLHERVSLFPSLALQNLVGRATNGRKKN